MFGMGTFPQLEPHAADVGVKYSSSALEGLYPGTMRGPAFPIREYRVSDAMAKCRPETRPKNIFLWIGPFEAASSTSWSVQFVRRRSQGTMIGLHSPTVAADCRTQPSLKHKISDTNLNCGGCYRRLPSASVSDRVSCREGKEKRVIAIDNQPIVPIRHEELLRRP